MSGWRTKVFGDNPFNFYGWIFAGLFIIGCSGREMLLALRAQTDLGQENHLLLAIYFLLLGQFAMSMQNYCARAAKRLDEKELKK